MSVLVGTRKDFEIPGRIFSHDREKVNTNENMEIPICSYTTAQPLTGKSARILADCTLFCPEQAHTYL